ncbi:hypothetical protein MMC14_001519 [Varicellaria rhodocarpa]|nr:hypothetical protein [Varicellaria rhodocarpa]
MSQNVEGHNLDICDYLPIGCLTIGAGSWLITCDEWTETIEIKATMPKDNQPLWKLLRTLLPIRWIRIFTRRHELQKDLLTLRVFVLPDDVGRRYVARNDKKLRKALRDLTKLLDVSTNGWDGSGTTKGYRTLHTPDNSMNDSLFYTFNTLSSPRPDPAIVTDPDASDAINQLLYWQWDMAGLKTSLYPYQQRSAAMMIQREAQPARTLDPRLESREGPTGKLFYLDQEANIFLKEKREYDEAQGGILAETMGHGKTVICLAAVLATKGHWPRVPPEYSLGLHPVRPVVGSLLEMAAAAAGRLQVPWKAHFQALLRGGEDYERCIEALARNTGSYIIPSPESRSRRRSSMDLEGETIRLCTATLIIVPSNLVAQWQAEIDRHLEPNTLSILVLDSFEQKMPDASELLSYDIILMNRSRFEREFLSNQMTTQRRKPSDGCICTHDNCRCSPLESYRSPLRDLHFLRLIVDEGHNFASGAKSSAIHVLQMLHVERRWIVSGTPAEGLLGVEVGIAATETCANDVDTTLLSRQESLDARKKSVVSPQERKDLEKLGYIVTDFLALKPWAIPQTHEDYASWHSYVVGTKGGQRKVKSLKNTLESLVVRHRIEDVEADLHLPPLHNRVVRLTPCYYDKLTINIFLMQLTANAVTSERADQDYMFHPSNRKALDELIRNLRQSGFYWTGFSANEVTETVRVSREYLKRKGSNLNEHDRALLEKAVEAGMCAMGSSIWRAFSRLNEMGLFVDGFPDEAQTPWTLTAPPNDCPLVMGVTQVGLAQKFIREHLYASDPTVGLSSAGKTVMRGAWATARATGENKIVKLGNSGSPHPVKKARKISQTETGVPKPSSIGPTYDQRTAAPRPPSALKSALKDPTNVHFGLPRDSPLTQTQLSGTASAKLSYLVDQISTLHHTEKSLIFYEGNNIAYYIAQALEVIGIPHLIYANGITTDRRNAYLTMFNTTETFRVMIMDLRQAAHGLHVASASRVFFVNPVWQPFLEAQAIKRAHRIGQTRPVYVETLVLKDTLEDQILQRRQTMTSEEHENAQRNLLDDSTMSDIIKNASFIPLTDQEIQTYRERTARLQAPRSLFKNLGRGSCGSDNSVIDTILPDSSANYSLGVQRGKRTAQFAFESDAVANPDWTTSTPSKKQKSRPVRIEEEEGDCIVVASPKRREKPQKSARFATPV